MDLFFQVSSVFKETFFDMCCFLGHAWHAVRLHKAMAGLGTDEEGLIRAVTMMDNVEFHAAAQMLKKTKNYDLDKRIKGEVSGDMGRALSRYAAWASK